MTARTSICGTAWCTSARASRRSSARSRCTPARSARCATTPGCATPAVRRRQRRRSSSPREVGGWPARELNQTFTRLIREVGLDGRGARAGARGRMISGTPWRCGRCWAGMQAGEDVDRRMPLLSTYLGHVDPASTYWYLEAVPELLAADQPTPGAAAGGALMTAARAGAAGVLHRASDHPTQLQPADGRRLPRHVQAAARLRPASRPASSRSSWTSTISTRR